MYLKVANDNGDNSIQWAVFWVAIVDLAATAPETLPIHLKQEIDIIKKQKATYSYWAHLLYFYQRNHQGSGSL